MRKFTKGDWKVEAVYGDHFIVLADNRTVADCFGNESNARLIASAPEMYKVLKLMLDAILDYAPYGNPAMKARELLGRIDGKASRDERA